MTSSTIANYDIDEKNKNKSVSAGGLGVDLCMKRHARSHPKRSIRQIDPSDGIPNGHNINGLAAYMPPGQSSHGPHHSLDRTLKSNVLNILSNINSSSPHHHLDNTNNSKTKGSKLDGHQMKTDVNNLHLAPTTVESKDIL